MAFRFSQKYKQGPCGTGVPAGEVKWRPGEGHRDTGTRGSSCVAKGRRQGLINVIPYISYLMGFPINATVKDEAPVI